MKREGRRKVARAVGALCVVAGLALVLMGLGGVIDGFVRAPKIDAAHRCAAGETGRCLASRRGFVRSSERDRIVVCEEDGCVEHTLAADSNPTVGTRVRVESWDGDDVAVVDLATEHRYRTMWWPRAWDPYGIGVAVAGLFVVGIGVAVRYRV